MTSDNGSIEKRTPKEFEQMARAQCDDILAQVRAAFSPSDGIEALVLLGFIRGACWALGMDDSKTRRSHAIKELSDG